jgi:predicted transcriptional regulator
MTLTIKLPDEIAARLAALPEDERERYALEALRDRLDEDAAAGEYGLTPDDLADIGEGLADADAGRVANGAEFLTELNERLDRLRAAKRQARAA